MPLVPTGELVHQARQQRTALGAFNAICLEHAEAIAMGAESAGRPAIIQISENAVQLITALGSALVGGAVGYISGISSGGGGQK